MVWIFQRSHWITQTLEEVGVKQSFNVTVKSSNEAKTLASSQNPTSDDSVLTSAQTSGRQGCHRAELKPGSSLALPNSQRLRGAKDKAEKELSAVGSWG